jgi:uncharacterized integral membrane protein
MRGLRRRGAGGLDEAWQPRLWVAVVGLLVLVAYVAAFVIKNDGKVGVDFVLGTAHASLIWVILLSLGLGLVAGLLLSQLYRRRGRQERG